MIAGQKALPTAYLLDPEGVVGNGYDAKTIPAHIFNINMAIALVFAGGINDKPTRDKEEIKRPATTSCQRWTR